MKLSIKAGATSQSVNVFIQDSSSTTGAGLSGLVFNTAGLTAYYSFSGASATATAITLATLATVTTAWSSGGFIEIDATHMKGVYRLDIPNAVVASGNGRSVVVYLYGATNMAPLVLEIELTGWDNQDAVHGGMSALPNTACTTNASLITSGPGTDQLTVSGGIGSADAKKINAVATTSVTTVNANIGTTAAITFDANSLPKVDVEDINGNATAAQNVSKANQAIGRGTCTTGGSTTSIPTSAWSPGGAGVVSGQFIGRTIIFDAGTATAALQGQATNITENTAGATPTFTVTALTTAPSSGDTFSVV